MELKDIYKLNPRILNFKEEKRVALVDRRKSKRQDCFDLLRDCSNESEETKETAFSKPLTGKENRRDLLAKWKDERRKENLKNTKKPFVVGIVRHNAGSPMFHDVPSRVVKQPTRKQTAAKSTVFTFGKQKSVPHQFKVTNSVKKLTVPITPSFMDPSKRGNLAEKFKGKKLENAKGTAAIPPKLKTKKTAKATEPTERRVTRATGKVGKQRSPMKRTPPSAEECLPKPSTSKAEFVPSPPVRVNRNREQTSTSVKKETSEVLQEEDAITCKNKSAAQGYYDNLQKETDFLLRCCDEWTKPAFSQIVPQEVTDEIDSTVGQAKLLVSDKFQQFKNLIHRFEEDSTPPVTCGDLDGFWDMMYIQVEKMREKFNQLAELKSNNWVKKAVEVIARKKVVTKPKAKTNVKSRFKEFMAKRKDDNNSKENSSQQNMSVGKNDQDIKPNEDSSTNTPLKERLMQQVLNTSRSGRRRSSIASASRVLRTSLIGKTLALSPLVKSGEMTSIEVRKSILRNNCPASPLSTSVRVTRETKKKVGFGTAEPIQTTDISKNILSTQIVESPAEENVDVTPLRNLYISEDNQFTPRSLRRSIRLAGRVCTPHINSSRHNQSFQ